MPATRRDFLRKSIWMGGSLAINPIISMAGNEFILTSSEPDAFSLSVFSKHLQWLNYQEMATLVAEMGFDGIDLTVRPAGHVLPEKVTEDLPKAVEIIRKAGLNVYMITTAITDAKQPYTEAILKTASGLGIRHYRLGWLNYDDSKSIEDNLTIFESQLSSIAAMNEKYSISGEYQNHSGKYFGASIWDLDAVLKKINSPWIGSQYDILHATIEGANAWPIGFKLLNPYVKSLDLKDFEWTKKEGKSFAREVPFGTGIIDYKTFLAQVKQQKLSVPLSAHFEYELGGAENGATKLTIDKDEVIKAMKRDCRKIREMLKGAGLV
ncbi:MAG: sugar phosphate isomerase/epimerase family protein [Chryseolinea sp.]